MRREVHFFSHPVEIIMPTLAWNLIS